FMAGLLCTLECVSLGSLLHPVWGPAFSSHLSRNTIIAVNRTVTFSMRSNEPPFWLMTFYDSGEMPPLTIGIENG
ncbi:MAG: hypothetical protein ACJ746_30720, partial [Bryobacteraceae bacterium]